MNNKKIMEFKIRQYREEDGSLVGELDLIKELSYRYNPDFEPNNIFCAFDKEGQLIGVAHLEPHDGCDLKSSDDESCNKKRIHRLKIEMTLSEPWEHHHKLRTELLHKIIARGQAIKQEYPTKMIRLIRFFYSTEIQSMNYYIRHGFVGYDNFFLMEFDLEREIPEVTRPDGIEIKPNSLTTLDQFDAYYQLAKESFSGKIWSQNYVNWIKNAPGWNSFSAYSGKDIVGSIMTWNVGEENSTTEDIFVSREWRKKGVARFMITEMLKGLKARGKKRGLLSVFADNGKALALYKGLGYDITKVIIQFGYDL